VQAELDQLRESVASFDPTLPVEGVSASFIRAMLEVRRRRDQAFPEVLFSDPAWDILLVLYAAALANERTRMTDLCKDTALADATALRWTYRLERAGLVVRIEDDADRRQVFIRLSPDGVASMDLFFAQPQLAGLAV
jgi:DNA-binding MarR family transcriptional regulator